MLKKSFFCLVGLLAAGGVHAAERPWVDFAEFEHSGGCNAIIDDATNAAAIQAWDQEKLDMLYACAKAGPTPQGFMNGKVIFADNGGFDHFVKFATQMGIPVDKAKLKQFAETLWKGKVFYEKDRALLNKMGADVSPLLGYDLKDQLRFPAKVYCGQSLLDGRRESIIIDYAYTDTVKIDGEKPYNDNIDWIAGGQTKTGKRGLMVRDEIRMVRPGFYLGRAYMDRVFLLNFTLSTDDPVSAADRCWPGYRSN